jgi:hypothetical protein
MGGWFRVVAIHALDIDVFLMGERPASRTISRLEKVALSRRDCDFFDF